MQISIRYHEVRHLESEIENNFIHSHTHKYTQNELDKHTEPDRRSYYIYVNIRLGPKNVIWTSARPMKEKTILDYVRIMNDETYKQDI